MVDLPGQIKSALDLVNNTTTLEMENESTERLPDVHESRTRATNHGGIDFDTSKSLREQLLISNLKNSLRSMPQSSFVDSIIQMSNGSTEEIHDLKDSLVRAAQERPDCPRGTWVSRRKSHQETIDNFQRRLALDCYKLMHRRWFKC